MSWGDNYNNHCQGMKTCGLPRDNWMSLIAYPVRSRSQLNIRGGNKKAVGCRFHTARQLKVSFLIWFWLWEYDGIPVIAWLAVLYYHSFCSAFFDLMKLGSCVQTFYWFHLGVHELWQHSSYNVSEIICYIKLERFCVSTRRHWCWINFSDGVGGQIQQSPRRHEDTVVYLVTTECSK